jgi:hypothetical protein
MTAVSCIFPKITGKKIKTQELCSFVIPCFRGDIYSVFIYFFKKSTARNTIFKRTKEVKDMDIISKRDVKLIHTRY